VTRPSPGARQYQTHRQLLPRTSARLSGPGPRPLDAIIVPASRPAVNLDHAVTLARKLRCQLVVLCSFRARAADVNDLLASRNFSQAIVIDLPADYAHPALDFATSKPASLGLPESCVNPNVDLSTKRNLGLLLARMLGWERIFFMDDDIRDLDASDLDSATSMLGPFRTAGMRALDFPDNSVVCHGHRETGAYQDVFVSGSVLAVHCAELFAFFPKIYNEDWFFFYQDAAEHRLGWSGRDATQLCYDPFADPKRAAGQEFGDVMAEGLYSLLHYRIGADRATSDYWQIFLNSRMRFLEAVLARTEKVEPYLRKRIASSIETAMECSSQITPAICERYVALWKQDLATWEQRLKEMPRLPSARAALTQLSLRPAGRSPYELARIIGGTAGGVPKDARAGAVMIPSSLAPSAAKSIQSLHASLGAGVVTNGNPDLSFPQNVLPEARGSDGSARGVINRVSRIVRRVILADSHEAPEAPKSPEPIETSRSQENGRAGTGKHRKAHEPVHAPLTVDADDAYAGHQPVSC
jgi:hypothetical protein